MLPEIFVTDYLRANPETSDAYYNFKKLLAEYLGESSEGYTIVKAHCCDLIMICAREWALEWKNKC